MFLVWICVLSLESVEVWNGSCSWLGCELCCVLCAVTVRWVGGTVTMGVWLGTWYLYDVRCGWVGDHPNSSGWDGHPNFERQSFWKVLAIWLESRWKGTCTMCDVGEWGITQIQVDEMDILTLKDNHFGRYLQFGLRVAGRVLGWNRGECVLGGGSPKFKWMRWTS